ncbi:prolyl oligopeptidase family serine peptidase [uncultured Maricaulis sp.]|uniref:alpha/beta hydrolase family protein n=1 Tax=uncultured Maricaulis sp. TaxID=174710 RepID=UPI0030D8701B|tara:strand:- start:98431 stop:100419 length:1989 start_codon:yes stop_codon:yes gene_type:complete
MGDGRIQDFLRHVVEPQQYSAATLSPSGRYVIYVQTAERRGEGDSAILVDLDGDNGMTAQRVDVGHRRIYWVAWATDDQFLISIAALTTVSLPGRRPGEWVELPAPARVLSINRETMSRSAVLLEDRHGNYRNRDLSELTDLLPDDPDHILMPAYQGRSYNLYRVNILTGASEKVENGRSNTVAWFTANGSAVMRVDQSANGRHLYFFARTGRNDSWRRVTTFQTRDLFGGLPDFEWAGPSDVAGQIYVRARPDGVEFFGIYRFDLRTGEYLDPVAVRTDYDIARALIGGHTGEYFGYAYQDQRLRFEFADPEFDGSYKEVEDFLGEDVVVTPVGVGGDRMLFFVIGPTEPGVYYIYDRQDDSVVPLLATHPRVEISDLLPTQVVRYQARDGVDLTGYLTAPRVGATSGTPLIVMPHGGPEARDTLAFDPVVQYLAALGYAVLQPNYRGSSGFGRTFAESGYRQWGRAMQDDITDGVQWVVDSGMADPEHICIVGFSYGGYAALAGAALTPDLYRCAVAGAPVTDFVKFLDFKRDFDDEVYDYWVSLLGNPRTDRAEMQAYSPVYLADRITIPVFLFHGTSDETVPIEQSQRMAGALEAAGAEYRYFENPKVDHSWGTGTGFITMMRNLSAFLDDAMDGHLDSFEPTRPEEGTAARGNPMER